MEGISQDRFESLVEVVAANRCKIVKVAVNGLRFGLTLKSRHRLYDVGVLYDAATDSSTGVDP